MSFSVINLKIICCYQPIELYILTVGDLLRISHLDFGVEVTKVLRQFVISSSVDKNAA